MKSSQVMILRRSLVATLCAFVGLCCTLRAVAQTYTVPQASTWSQTTLVTGLTQTQELAVDGAGDIFYTQPAVGAFLEQPAGGGAAITLIAGGVLAYPKGVAVDTHGYAYASDYNGHLWKVPVGGGTAAVDILPACNSLDGYYLGTVSISTDAAGNVYTVGGQNFVFEITPAGVCSAIATSGAPSYVASDPAGNIYYAIGSSLYFVAAGTTTSTPVTATIGSIDGLATDSSGNLYITDSNSFIDELPFESTAINGGDKTWVYASGYIQSKVGFDPQGRLYATDGSNIYVSTLGSLEAGTLPVGTASSYQQINVVFNRPITVTGINLVSGTGTSTELANPGTGTCAAGPYTYLNQCTIQVTVTPSAIGARNGAVQLTAASGIAGTSFVTASGSGPGLVVDPGSQAAIGSGWTAPSGVAVDPTGSVFVVDSTANTVTYIPGGSGAPQVIASSLSQPSGIAVGPDGTVYVTNKSAGTLTGIASTGGVFSSPATVLTGLNSPEGVAVAGNGDVYVANTGGGSVLRFPNQSGAPNFFDETSVGSFIAPSGIAIDAGGNIFVTDTTAGTVTKLADGVASTIATGLNSPTGIAVDPTDDVFVLQAGSATVELIPFTGGAYSTNATKELGTGFTTPVALAANQTGSLFVADTGSASVTEIARNNGALNLGSADVGSSSAAQNLTLSNDGTSELTLGSPLYTASGDTGDFVLSAAATAGCTASGTVASGASCGVSVVFSPTATGVRTDTLQLSSNAANGSAIQATLSGTGTNLPKTALTLALTSPTGSISYGETVTVSGTVAPVSGTGTPTGTVQYLVNGTDYGAPVTLSSGIAGQSFADLPAGSVTISAIYSGDANFAASAATPLALTISLAPTTTIFTSSASSSTPVPPGTSVTFTATISSNVTSPSPTGTVTFLSGTSTLGVAALGATGVATFTSTTLPQGTYSVDAVYSGDSGFAASTSSSISIAILPAQFVPSSQPTTLAISAPGSATTTFVVTPISGYTGSVDMACSGLPANTTCSFLPATLNFIDVTNSAGATVPPSAQTVQLTVTTNTAPVAPIAGAGFFLLPLGFLLLGTRKRRQGGNPAARALAIGLLACASLLIMIPMSGCGSSSGPKTPAGSSAVTVTLTGTPSGTTGTVPPNGTTYPTTTFTFTLTVN